MSTGLFSELSLRSVRARNRLALSPMCQYSAGADGVATEWHRVHYGSRAVGGAGIVIQEATAVEPRGRITSHDLGLWNDEQAEALAPIADFVAEQGAVPAIQLAHAGRKASTTRPWEGSEPLQPEAGGWTVVGPSGQPYPYEGAAPPTERLDPNDIEAIVESFGAAAERAIEAGFQAVEIHAAHGYLLHEFLSPVTNQRTDAYGGDFEGRTRVAREVYDTVREAVGEEIPVFMRVSGTDWLPEPSWTIEDTVELGSILADRGLDFLDVSSGGIHPDQQIDYAGPNYQVALAEQVRAETDLPTVGAVGAITTPEQGEALIRNDRADVAIVGRKFLNDPYFGLRAAESLYEVEPDVPAQYRRGW
ncbi:NADH:flavin oxidoreductase/NADH oxidase [Halodesulfurarchaeum formicicum]|uniref:NADH-dependent flavin oxidoreductase n=1 Tax=Halodesulfurarchaeum formicicum TaxID=1873524 RepID=A0A1J1AAB1_9EURY|nr:NADH:flavin oxidoreductase/NADH oxidase [Halodesulfurarchaeum formicicum]APE94505.1 NADH-dependent flavin oxidoreductase [Halodesulfurarchaeum formicicum]